MSEFDMEDLQVMDMVNEHSTPEAAKATEKIYREMEKRIARPAAQTRNDSGDDCAPCDGEGYANHRDETEVNYGNEKNTNIAEWLKAEERKERWYDIRCRLKALWRLIIVELLGYAALGGVLVAGMIKGVIPMGVAVPAFVVCFMWVAVRFDRWIRRGW